jgi:hypothetical protein
MTRELPTFSRVRQYLTGLGFTYRTRDDAGRLQHVYEHKASGSLFIFPDYPPNKPTPNHALMPVHYHLTWNGVIDDIPYDQFLDLFAPAKAG